MNKEDRDKLLDVAGFLQGWLAFKKPVPPDEVVRLHFDLVMEVLAKNNEVLNLIGQRELLNELINNQEEIISSPIRFNGVSIQKIKQVFEKNGVKYESPF